MTNVLVIDSSATPNGSASRLLVESVLTHLGQKHVPSSVVHRNLGADPLPHLSTENFAGLRGTPSSAAERRLRAVSDTLIAELRAADMLVIGAPMYNFSISTGLRTWFDYVLRAGETFRYTEAGPQGLIGDKQVIVVKTSGGIYTEGPNRSIDFHEAYLRHLLGFMGLTDVKFIRAEKLAYGPDARSAALAVAQKSVAEIVAASRTVAA